MENTKSAGISMDERILQWAVTIAVYTVFIFSYSFGNAFGFPAALFGHKTVAMFDSWSFQHILSGFLLGRFVCFIADDKKEYPKRQTAYLALFFLAITWEWIELMMETGELGQSVFVWKGGVEHWTNRFIADPGLMIFGLYLWRKYRKYFWPVALAASAWLILNILMPNCMYIQQYLISSF